MDPLSASLGIAVLIKRIQKIVEQRHHYKHVPSSLSKIYGTVPRNLRLLERDLSLLQEITDLLGKSSTEYDEIFHLDFIICMSRAEALVTKIQPFVMLCEDENPSPQQLVKNSSGHTLEEGIRLIYNATHDLRHSISELVHHFKRLLEFNALLLGDTFVGGHAGPSHDFAHSAYRSVDNVFVHRKVDLPILAPGQAPPSNMGTNVVGLVTGLWNITFSAGLQNGTPLWGACRAKPDTGCNGNWIKHSVLSRHGLLESIRPVSGEPKVLVDASDHLHPVTHMIALTWYRNEEATSRTTEFFVIDSGPYEMMFGEEFVLENLEKLFPGHFTKKSLAELGLGPGLEGYEGSILAGRMRPMTKAERKQLEEDKRKYRQKNLELVAKEEEEEEEAKAKLADGDPAPIIVGVGKGTESKVSESSGDVTSSQGARISLEGLSLDPSEPSEPGTGSASA